MSMRSLTVNALRPACFTAVYIGAVGSGELVFICLFSSFCDLSPPISVTLLLCFEEEKINQITDNASSFKNFEMQ